MRKTDYVRAVASVDALTAAMANAGFKTPSVWERGFDLVVKYDWPGRIEAGRKWKDRQCTYTVSLEFKLAAREHGERLKPRDMEVELNANVHTAKGIDILTKGRPEIVRKLAHAKRAYAAWVKKVTAVKA